ncbi:MAG TPA: ribbon-helix-helix domain-containing protein [Clostridiales bacterium]|nr:ribbon-helix-helix domain-containing protein [Clostridiales bacterium]HQP68808.1 ribbon-helix-helix domain-containing protein [Clostridiales bacterium]
MNTTVTVRLPDNLATSLDAIAKITERSRSFLIKKAIESYIEEQADLQIALDRLRDTSDTEISAEDLKKSLNV